MVLRPGRVVGQHLGRELVQVLGVMALLASLDLFSLWVVVLLIVGFHLVARVSKAAAAGGVLVLWALFILIKVGWASLFG